MAQSDLPQNVLQLAQLKREVKSRLAALPNYTCVETIQRSRRRNAQEPFRLLDTVRIEVAVISNRELYSWPGANEFEDRDLGDMIGAGMISSGSFTSAISNVLLNNIATITWHGNEDLRGRRAVRWDYRIPYNLSDWTLRIEGRQGNVSETGSFWADAETLELLRLEINAKDIPPDLPITAANDSFDYSPMRVGSRDLLLPQTAENLVTHWNGKQSRNLIEFSHCREFAAEARLSFDAPKTMEKPLAPVAEVSLPAGLRFSIRLAKPVDSQVAKVGDPLAAEMVSSVEYKHNLVVPKGAMLRGRIRRLERYSTPRPHWVVGLEFTDIEFPGHHARFFGEMTGVAPGAGLSLTLSASQTETRDDIGLGGSVTSSRTVAYLPVQIPGVSTFFMEGSSFRLPEGLLMDWRSIALRK